MSESLSASLLSRTRPGRYVTVDGRFGVHGSGRSWVLEANNDADNQELILRKIPACHKSLGSAMEWLYCSVYEHGELPWPNADGHDHHA